MSNYQLPEGYKQTEVGVIPEDWDVVKIGSLEPHVTSGSRGWAKHYSRFGNPFIRITNLSRKSIYLDLTDLRLVNLPDGVSEGKRTELFNGDVLISITADIGIIGYIDNSINKPAYINQHISLVRFDREKTDSKFIAYFLASEIVQRLFRGATDQGAKAGLNLDTVRKLNFAFPPFPEQRAIASTLSDVDALIASLDKLIAKQRHLKTATMQQLLTGKKRLPGFGDEWGKGLLGYECSLITKGTTPTSLGHSFREQGINFIKIETITEDGIFLPGRFAYIDEKTHRLLGRSQLQQGDILFSIAGALGRCASVPDELLPANTNQALAIIRLKTDSQLDRQFLLAYLKSPVIRNHIEAINVQAAQANLSLENINDFEIRIPPVEEQRAIATVLSDMDAAISALETRRAKTQAIKQGMMQQLLTGRVRLTIDSASQ